MSQKYIIASATKIYKRLFGYVRHYWVALIIAVIASIVYSGIDAWFIYFLKPMLNKGLVAKDREFLKLAPLLILIIFTLRGVSSFFSNYNIATVSRSVIMRMRQDIFAHIQKLPIQYFDLHPSASLVSAIIYDVEQVANAGAEVVTSLLQSLFLVIGLIIVMLSISWHLTVLYFVLVPFIIVIMRITSRRVRKLSLSIQSSMAQIMHQAEENISGYKTVRAFGGEAFEKQKFDAVVNLNRAQEMKVVAARTLSTASVQFIAATALASTLYIATLHVANAVMTAGGFVSMIAAMLAILKPMKDLTMMQNKLHRGLAGAQSAFALLDQETEADLGQQTLECARGKIIFSHVNFAYSQRKPVLHDINFTIFPGEIVALVGRSGSGKSTLASLLPRFYQHYSGEIYLDDQEIRNYRLAELRQQFAIVSQNVTLFHDTIANNIAYGCQHKFTEQDILHAAKMAHALEFIEHLPQGLNSVIGDNGVLLSGGQRQRIAIARAILKNSPILILDEATSALDTESERFIQAALGELMQRCTTLVIAHRLSTIEHADKIIVLDHGHILEMGKHEELLVKDGHYTKLYKMQFKE